MLFPKNKIYAETGFTYSISKTIILVEINMKRIHFIISPNKSNSKENQVQRTVNVFIAMDATFRCK